MSTRHGVDAPVRRLEGRASFVIPVSSLAFALGGALEGIAQKLGHLPLLSGSLFRIAFLVPALGLWIWATMRYAARTRTTPEAVDLSVRGFLEGLHGAILAASGVRYEAWMRFVLPVYAALLLLSILALGAGIALGLS